MNEKAKKVKKNVLETINSEVSALFKESENATQLVYKSSTGKEAYECPGAYSSYMTSLMVRDMTKLSLLLMKDSQNASKAVRDMTRSLEEKDLAIRRMFDDRNDHRPVIEYPYDDTAKLIADMTEVTKSGALKNCILPPDEVQVKAWVTRLLKADIMAYYTKVWETLDKAIMEAENRIYDEDNNLIHGINKTDAECVRMIAEMEKILLKALIRIPAESKEVQPTLGRIELMEVLIKAIIEEDKGTIERLCKYAEAAAEFKE